ncbi:MAG: hypothetical protein ACE5HT_12305 [Gemmatimonadales bacterium]
MRRSITSLALLVVGLAVTSTLNGQLIDKDHGLWIAAGVGGASIDVDCPSRCPSSRKVGFAGFFQIGGVPSSRVPVGVEFDGWRRDDSSAQREYFLVSAFFDFYPVEHGPLFLHFGAGAGRYAQETPGEDFSATGFGFQFGGGYEISLSRHLVAAPFARFLFALGQNSKVNRFSIESDLDFNMLQLGGQIRWFP